MIDVDDMTSNVGALLAFAASRCEPKIITIPGEGGKPITALLGSDQQGGVEVYDLKGVTDPWRTRPERRIGNIRVDTISSFVEMVNRDSVEDSVIFADTSGAPKLVAVLNFHGAGNGAPAFCDDRITYPFPLSDEWKAWTGHNGEAHKMNQATFAEFIEDRLFDIGEPGAAGNISKTWADKMQVRLAGPQDLMRVSRGLSIRVEETVRNSVVLDSGEMAFTFTVDHKDPNAGEGTVKVPNAFHVLIPILKGEPAYSIPVRLRYRAGGGKITWFYEMHRPELFLLDAVKEAIDRVRLPEDAVDGTSVGCGLPVVMGAPPA